MQTEYIRALVVEENEISKDSFETLWEEAHLIGNKVLDDEYENYDRFIYNNDFLELVNGTLEELEDINKFDMEMGHRLYYHDIIIIRKNIEDDLQ